MLSRLAELFIFGFAPLVVGALMMPGQSLAQEKMVSGEVLYRERIALPPNAVLTVQLADVSLADAPASVIAEQTIKAVGQVPIKFELRFDPSVIRPKMSYALQARITVDDQLWFINDTRYGIDPLDPAPQTLLLKMVKQSAKAPGAIFGATWLAEDIEGGGVADSARSTLSIDQDGKVSGRGACNGYFGMASIEGDRISFGHIGATSMACAPALMEQESKFFAALRKATNYRVEDGKLLLVDKEGRAVIRLAAEG